MDQLRTFIAAWEESGDIASVIEQGLALPPAAEAQSYLASLPPTERDRLTKSLSGAMIALEEYAAHLAKDQAATKAQIDQSMKTAKACLSYTSAGSTRRK